VKSGASLNWLVPDLDGNVAAQLDGSAAATITYPWGEVTDIGPGSNTGSVGTTRTLRAALAFARDGVLAPGLSWEADT